MASCRYHWRLIGAVITFHCIFPRFSYHIDHAPNFLSLLCIATCGERGCKIHMNQLVLETNLIPTDIYATVVAEAAGGGGAEEFLLRPQRTPRSSPSMSSPFAHASAARSADTRSLKFTNAHLTQNVKLRTRDAHDVNHLDFATCTIERKDACSTPGNDLTTRVRMVSSVAEAGKEERNSDIWSYACQCELGLEQSLCKSELTTDSSSGGLRPCCSACPAKILRATGSFCPKNLSWIFCFDSSFFTGISCLNMTISSHKRKKRACTHR